MSGRAGRVLGQALWGMAMAVLGLAVTGLQMDSQSAKDLALAHTVSRLVPAPFQGNALKTLAIDAYGRGDVELGLLYSRRLVALRPIPAESLSLMMRGSLLKGDDAAAVSALVLAAQRGWRDNTAQYMMAASALQVDDTQVAAQRLIALWRRGQGQDLLRKHADDAAQLAKLTQTLLQQKDGANAFANIILKTDDWGTDLLVWAAGTDIPIEALGKVAAGMARNHIATECSLIRYPLRKVALRGGTKGVRQIWSQLCKHGPVTAPADFAFKSSDDADSPLDWQLPGNAGLSSRIEESGDVMTLQYDNGTHRNVIVAQRVMALEPGQHTIRVVSTKGDDLPFVQVMCFARSGSSSSVVRAKPSNGLLTFGIPTERCDGQDLILSSHFGPGSVQKVAVDESH